MPCALSLKRRRGRSGLVERGGTFYTFRLRRGVKFHHGRELTADDVKFSLERLVAPITASQGATLYTGLTIPGMDAVGASPSKSPRAGAAMSPGWAAGDDPAA